jgi:hypothetical protein
VAERTASGGAFAGGGGVPVASTRTSSNETPVVDPEVFPLLRTIVATAPADTNDFPVAGPDQPEGEAHVSFL